MIDPHEHERLERERGGKVVHRQVGAPAPTNSGHASTAKIAPVRNSTIAYRPAIRAPQARHRPRSNSQPSTGTLSRNRIGFLHAGQCEPGQSRLIPCATARRPR